MLIVFRGRDCRTENSYVLVNGEQLNNISSAVHLGHSISADDSEYTISASLAQFWKRFSIFRADYGKIYPYVQCKLFKQYCSFYGVPLWSSYHKCVSLGETL